MKHPIHFFSDSNGIKLFVVLVLIFPLVFTSSAHAAVSPLKIVGRFMQDDNRNNIMMRGVAGYGINAASPAASKVSATLIGPAGIAAWDALPAGEKLKVRTTIQSFFLHQSVGGDLEDGADAGGYRFEYADSGATRLATGLNGGLFSSSNGDPAGKIDEFRAMATANSGTVKVAIMKFGYADIVGNTLALAQSDYLAAVNAIKAQGVRVLHVTPPLVYNAPTENAPKMRMRTWMIDTFPNDAVFDLGDIESTDPATGARCQRGGSWEICDRVRSTAACPSLNQGIDAASGQGHLCYAPHAQRFAKAFLYAIYRAADNPLGTPWVPENFSAVEFYKSDIDHYFMTADSSEATSLDNNTAWNWVRTGETYRVWLTQASAPSNATPVCRFYGVFSNGTIGSHFYTADTDECEYVKTRADWGWSYEGIAFFAVKPVDGSCPNGTSPIYRVYNNGIGNAPNHRYMASQPVMNAMIAQGWVSEGLVFCGGQ